MKQDNFPQNLSEIIGQNKIKEYLSIQIAAARKRGEVLDHILFCGPYGSGKSTLAHSVANEMENNIKIFDSSSIRLPGDLAAILTNLRTGDILLIEQIETLRKTLIEILYPVLEDFTLDIVVEKEPSAQYIKLKLNRFTIIGTTSKPSRVDERLKNNMYVYALEPYDENELGEMIMLFAKQNKIDVDKKSANLLAKYTKGLPSEASKLLRSVHNYAIARGNGVVTLELSKQALTVLMG